jgi:hypothetical protein
MKFFETLKSAWTWLTKHKFIAGVIVGYAIGMIFLAMVIILRIT